MTPNKVAIEKPTIEVLQFIDHVYGLNEQVYPPANGFVVFNDFFDDSKYSR